MFERESLKYVIQSLVNKEKHKECEAILDHFYSIAQDIDEYDAVGEMALISKYHEMNLKCSIATYTRCKTSEQLYNARTNLYKAYNTLNYPEKALFYIEQNLRIKPDDLDTIVSKGFSLSLMGKTKEAEDLVERISPKTEEEAKGIELALAGKHIREGKTAKGIVNFNTAYKAKNHLFTERLKLKFWDGAPQPGRTIVINGEGGVGDEIINIRFFKHLRDYGMNPILYSSWYNYRPDIVEVFRRNGFSTVTNPLFFHKDWLWTHMMALPGYLGVTEQDLWYGPYLTAKKDPKNNLNDKKFKIGIKCNGNPYFDQDIYRSIPIEELLAALPSDASVYFFDKEKTHPKTISLKDKLTTWDDTFDYIDQMDIIVSSCTSLVHAAGSIGKKTIVIPPILEYYTWISTRTDGSTPWYGDNLQIVRQTKLRSWKEPLEQVQQILAEEIKSVYNKSS